MTMTANVRAFQILERADITFGEGVTLIAAENSNGKSSAAKAIAGAMAGDPLHGYLKKDVKALVKDGAKSGSVTITGPGGSISVSYPKAEVSSTGTPPTLGRIAAGLDSLVDIDQKKRGLVLGELLKTAPTREDLAAALADAGFKDEPAAASINKALEDAGKTADPALSLMDYAKLLKAAGVGLNIVHWLWWQIETRGWDGALKKLEGERTELKGRWAEVSGEAFGDQKIQDWKPEGWTPDLAEVSADGLQAVLTAANTALETVVAEQAVDQSELDRLRVDAGKLDALQEAEQAASKKKLDAEVTVVDAENTHRAAEQAVANLPPAEQDSGLSCPHCQGKVHYHKGQDGERLDKAERLSDDVLKQRRLDRITVEGTLNRAKVALSTARADLQAAQRVLDDAQRAVAGAESAKRKLIDLEAQSAGKSGSAEAVQKARDAVATAQLRLDLFQTKARADGLARRITSMSAIIGILAPTGLRQANTQRVLDTFNDSMVRPLCDAAGWKAVRIEPDMNITYGGRPYSQLSGLGPQLSSDQYRVRAILQVALAERAGDRLVILDAADILDQKGRNGLFGMLKRAGMAAVVCMTFSAAALKKGNVPDLEKAKIGRTYWVCGGVAQPLAAVTAAAPQATPPQAGSQAAEAA
ncbi:hypothetical protein FW320_06505 [Azospirillum sp. Vi22]|uniref:hypothetical protein n=1 Tax=Azospirillum baldaniorum TaxID=1064539 RepID=UPI00157B329D|nr:hypothetical protein [Azospirillum baldaniorum]NUB05826.1 hypothetical protein [Azospirillum baldaniorum]